MIEKERERRGGEREKMDHIVQHSILRKGVKGFANYLEIQGCGAFNITGYEKMNSLGVIEVKNGHLSNPLQNTCRYPNYGNHFNRPQVYS